MSASFFSTRPVVALEMPQRVAIAADHLSMVEKEIGNQVTFLQFVQDGDCLALETGTKPCRQFLYGTDPLAGMYRIADCMISEEGNRSRTQSRITQRWERRRLTAFLLENHFSEEMAVKIHEVNETCRDGAEKLEKRMEEDS